MISSRVEDSEGRLKGSRLIHASERNTTASRLCKLVARPSRKCPSRDRQKYYP
jgi:hypothetical protein